MAATAVGRVQRADQIRRGGHQEFRRATGRNDYRRTVPQGVRRRLSVGSSRHRRYGVHRVGPGHHSAWSDRSACRNVRRIREGASVLTVRISRWFLGLGLAAGAVLLPIVARAQDTTRARPDTSKIRRDSVKLAVPVPPHADSLIRRDSTGLPRNVPLPVPSDTIKAPLAHAPVPRTLTSDGSLHFDRAQIFATGSVTLQDLLTRALIATPSVAGYLSAPANAAVAGDFRRVR